MLVVTKVEDRFLRDDIVFGLLGHGMPCPYEIWEWIPAFAGMTVRLLLPINRDRNDGYWDY
ncbi:hypothetical protein ACFLSQ_03330 [Bacteroidota bacterium]